MRTTFSASPHPDRRTVMLIMANALDCDALSLWCKCRLDCHAIESANRIDAGLDRCLDLRPQLLALDPSVAPNAIERGAAALCQRVVGHLLILDSQPFEARLAEILPLSGASYVSRTAPPQVLADAMAKILCHGARVFDPALASRVRHTDRGYEFDHSPKSPLSLLSRRERQVMRLLAEGRTVRQCAESLGLSLSTIDNHKARLMKKLGVHKASELTLRAIREGLVVL
jgi:two-component system response regulator NreC